jgi:hypothetical protein
MPAEHPPIIASLPTKPDDLVKSPFCPIFVIPAKAGIQSRSERDFKYLKILWTPVSTGVTTFYEIIKPIIS